MKRTQGFARNRLAIAWLCLGALGVGCVYDPADRCGPEQGISNVGACVCLPGLVLHGTKCEPCPEHEHEVDGACYCDDDYARPAAGQQCAAVVNAGLGAACRVDVPCTDPTFSVCRSGGVAGSYCSRTSCTTDAECGGDYACNDREAPAFCERPPLGQGAACASSMDCEHGDATFCDTFISKLCLVPECSLETPNCFSGWECCDLSGVGIPELPKTVCVPEGQCTF